MQLINEPLPETISPHQHPIHPIQCQACHQGELHHQLASYGFDSSKERFDLYSCSHCRLTSTIPFLNIEELGRYYHSEYYGGSEDPEENKKSKQKFNPVLETIVRIANQARAKKLISYMNQSAPQGPAEIELKRKFDRAPLSGGKKSQPEVPRFPRLDSIRILDIGCGRGNFLKELAKAGYTCVGTDISAFEHEKTDRISFLQGTLEELKLTPASFDAVSIWHVLEHVRNPVDTLKEISSLLKPNGILALAVPNFGSWQSKLFRGHSFHLDLPRHLFHFDLQSLMPLLKENDFQIISTHTLSWDQNIYGWIQSFQNLLFHKTQPNELFTFLKNKQPLHSPGFLVNQKTNRSKLRQGVRIAGLVCLGGLSLLPALLETIVSSWFGKGATLVIYARYTGNAREKNGEFWGENQITEN